MPNYIYIAFAEKPHLNLQMLGDDYENTRSNH